MNSNWSATKYPLGATNFTTPFPKNFSANFLSQKKPRNKRTALFVFVVFLNLVLWVTGEKPV